MQLDPKKLFDEEPIRAAARPGQQYLNNTAPVFLVICSSEEDKNEFAEERSIKSVTIYQSEADVMRFIKSHYGLNTIFELVGTAHLLHDCLLRTQPSQRGRPSK